MSRHRFSQKGTVFVVGWDRPLATFFLSEIFEEGEGLELGQAIQEFSTVEELANAAKRVGITVPDHLLLLLEKDKEEEGGLELNTPLQNAVLKFLGGL